MNTSPDSVIAALLAAHTSHQAAREANAITITVTRNAAPSERGTKGAKRVMGAKAPKPAAPSVFGVVMPEAKTLDALGYLAAVKVAGQRKDQDGKTFTDSREVRGDLIVALAAYIGYDRNRDFGLQDAFARSHANRVATGRKIDTSGPSRSEERAANRALTGRVGGMPDYMAAKVGELRGRERHTVDSLIEAHNAGDVARVATLEALLSNVRDELKQIG